MLLVEWPAPSLTEKSSHFGGFYLTVQTVVRTHLPPYLDSVAALTISWLKPMSPPHPCARVNTFIEFKGAGEAGLVSVPQMEHSLAAYLALTQNSGIAVTPYSTRDYILCATHSALMSLGHAMVSTVVARRYLCLTLANLPERDLNAFRSTPISPSILFEEGLNAFQCERSSADQCSQLHNQGLGHLPDHQQL